MSFMLKNLSWLMVLLVQFWSEKVVILNQGFARLMKRVLGEVHANLLRMCLLWVQRIFLMFKQPQHDVFLLVTVGSPWTEVKCKPDHPTKLE